MAGPEVVLNARISGYMDGGSQEARVTMHALLPSVQYTKSPKMASVWLQNYASAIVNDMKHSGDWGCVEGCGRHASEARVEALGWLYAEPPVALIYLFQLCDAGPDSECAGKIASFIRAMQHEIHMDKSVPRRYNGPSNSRDRRLSSTCGQCHGSNHTPDAKMSICSGCRLTRYCSAACQKAAWQNHKPFCKTIKSVEWGDEEEGPSS